MNIDLQELGIDPSLFQSIVDAPEIFTSTGRQTQVVVGNPVNYPLTINKKSFNAQLLVHSAHLQRLSLIQNNQIGTNRDYYIVTGIFNPLKMDVIININGENINIIDFLFAVTKQASNNNDYTKDELLNHLKNIRFPLNSSMPMFFQQMGANKAEYFKATEILSNAGGIIDSRNNGRIIHSCGFTKEMTQNGIYGPKVLSFEVGTTDPTQTALYKWGQTHNQQVGEPGFVNFGESIITQFTRLTAQRKKVAMLSQSKEEEGLNQVEIQQIETEIKNLKDMSTQWASAWSGSQQRWVREQNGDFIKENIFDPINVPCGRFGLDINNEIVNINLWTNKADNNQENTIVNTEEAIKKFHF